MKTTFETKLERLAKNLNKLVSDTPKMVRQYFEENNKELPDYNRDNLFSGEYTTGGKIEPPYTPKTIAIKRRKGQPTNRVTLKDTGAFHASIKQKTTSSKVLIFATDAKLQKLESKYAKAEPIIGINKEQKEETANNIKFDLLTKWKKVLF